MLGVALLLLVATVMWLAAGPAVRRISTLTPRGARGEGRVAMPGDDEVAELSRAFDAATDALRDREAALRDFVAGTAHDVRIPMTVPGALPGGAGARSSPRSRRRPRASSAWRWRRHLPRRPARQPRRPRAHGRRGAGGPVELGAGGAGRGPARADRPPRRRGAAGVPEGAPIG
ncbi:MAG: hypothetical protein R3F59_00695 [Myxococcota bacterium]